jgi:hypothetical protein
MQFTSAHPPVLLAHSARSVRTAQAVRGRRAGHAYRLCFKSVFKIDRRAR